MIEDFFDFGEEEVFDYYLERKKFIDNMNFLKSMSVQEQTLYKKWEECRSYKHKYESSIMTRSNIWCPTDINNKELTIQEIQKLRPVVRLAVSESELEHWTNLRIFSHTMSYDVTPGRFLRFLIIDENTETFLGAVSLSSDVTTITERDNYIGWNKEDKFERGKLNNTSIASCIMSTQPFGYNFLGGKLVASIITGKYVRDMWENTYGNVLAGLTTTSLYGTNSMYNSIPYWKKLGETAGQVFIKPDDEYYMCWLQWLKKNKSVEYEAVITRKDDKDIPVTGVKQRILNLIFRELQLKTAEYVHGFKRGIYFSEFYENSRNFLCSKIESDDLKLKDKFKDDTNGIISWWKKKAIERYSKLYDENRLNSEILWYNKVPFMTWNKVKETYLKDVGR
jgi:hypothetical protein